MLGKFVLHLLILFFIYSILSISWNLIGGFTGQISFGHAAFFGTGAYTVALLMRSGLNMYFALLIAGLMAAIIALPIGYICLRLTGPFFLIVTLGIGEIFRLATLNSEILGGSLGMVLPVSMAYSKIPYYYCSFIVAALILFLTYRIKKSSFGLALQSIREDVTAASVIGVNPTKYLVFAFSLSCFFAGLSGGLKALYDLYIEPNSTFGFTVSISAVLMTVIGGIGTVWGPVIGSFIFVILQQFLLTSFPMIHLLVYGSVLIFLMLFEPKGFLGFISRVKKYLSLIE
jgi:branched-chain amino acid transport system permease protein